MQFDQELGHMTALNAFISEAWGKFQAYFLAAADVGEAEEYFGINEFSDITMVAKPIIFLSQEEIFYLHEVGHARVLQHVFSSAASASPPIPHANYHILLLTNLNP